MLNIFNRKSAQRLAAKEAEEQLDQIFYNVFEGNTDGQNIYLDLLNKFHDRTSVSGSPVDVSLTMVREGERNVVLYIMKRLSDFQVNKK